MRLVSRIDDNEWELIGFFSLSNKLDWVRLELSAPMKRFFEIA
ncbi:hypothetical protein [Helicobacter pylori]|nr:hypothetical protein [Helicobacter pylori]